MLKEVECRYFLDCGEAGKVTKLALPVIYIIVIIDVINICNKYIKSFHSYICLLNVFSTEMQVL